MTIKLFEQTLDREEKEVAKLKAENERLQTLVDSYDRQDELIGTEFEGVDEVTDVIRLLKQERDSLAQRVVEFEKYAQHLHTCDCAYYVRQQCTCGLSALLRK